MAKQIEYPADTVDSSGKAWNTIGENIRNGAKNKIVEEATNLILDALYPIGSTYIGELPQILKTKFTWERGTSSSTQNLATMFYSVNNIDQKITISTMYTIPILTNDEVNTFAEKTGITLRKNCFLVPIFHRIA